MPEHIHQQSASVLDQWGLGTLLFTILMGWLYFYLMGKGRHRFPDSSPVSVSKKVYFVCGLILFYTAMGSPINYYGHADLFSAHMLQQSLVYLAFPPLFYLGLPDWFLTYVLDRKWVKRIVYPFTQPLLAILSFNLLFSFYHIPLIFNAVYGHEILHYGYHLVLLFSAFQMWFPVFVQIPGWKRLSYLQRMAYIFANGVLLTPACALIIFAGTVIYPAYDHVNIFGENLTALHDQQLGGTLMKILQELVYGWILAHVFFKWYHTERKKDEEDEAAEVNRLAGSGSIASN